MQHPHRISPLVYRMTKYILWFVTFISQGHRVGMENIAKIDSTAGTNTKLLR